MFKGLAYRRKFQLLLAASTLLALLAYQFGIRKTLDAIRNYKELNSKFALVEQAPERLAEIKKQLNDLDQSIRTEEVDNALFQSSLLETVSEFCRTNDLVIKDFPQTMERQVQDFTIEQNKIVVAGDFKSALKLAYLLEQEQKIGQVISSDFKMTMDRPTKRKFLQTTIYFQKIKSNEDNK